MRRAGGAFEGLCDVLAAGLTQEEQEPNEKRTITPAFAFHRLAPSKYKGYLIRVRETEK